MTQMTASAQRTGTSSATAITTQLESARSQVEKRFLDGGAVLLSVMDVLNGLLSSLDQVTKTLDSENASDTTADLLATVRTISELPAIAESRQGGLVQLSGAGNGLRTHVTDMQETMRYLQTFAVTVKITGAGIPEFAGFAEEILERIRSGTSEVNTFADQLNALQKELKIAQTFGAEISTRYAQTVPGVVKALETDAATIAAHRQTLGVIAKQVGALARGVQNKVASTLSALQIGDITRQRIEHVQSTLSMLDDFLHTGEGRQLTPDARARLENVFHHLAAAQMADMIQDFQRESRNVVETIASFSHDTNEILSLRNSMQGGDGDSNVMRTLEESVLAARTIVKQVESASLQADQVGQSTTTTATRLLQGIENIRSVKTDIHYMALNTNLRCSRMGEEGRSINVVTAELRIFAAKLDESADAIVNGLSGFEDAAATIAQGSTSAGPGLEERLNAAIGNIRNAANAMDAELAALSEHGREVASKIGLSISRLDFQHDLGEVLAGSADRLYAVAGDEIADVSDIPEAVNALSQTVFKLYTMAQERAVHHSIVPAANQDHTSSPQTAPASDEELFEDALF